MKLTVEDMRGMWRGQIDNRTEFADTLEELLLKLAPAAPEEYVWHGAEVLGAILGAEVVEVPQELPEGVYNSLGALFASLDGAEPGDESWEPTDAQKEYFTTEHDALDINEYPRGV